MRLDSRFYPFFFFNDTATTEIYTLSLHDALPIWRLGRIPFAPARDPFNPGRFAAARVYPAPARRRQGTSDPQGPHCSAGSIAPRGRPVTKSLSSPSPPAGSQWIRSLPLQHPAFRQSLSARLAIRSSSRSRSPSREGAFDWVVFLASFTASSSASGSDAVFRKLFLGIPGQLAGHCSSSRIARISTRPCHVSENSAARPPPARLRQNTPPSPPPPRARRPCKTPPPHGGRRFRPIHPGSPGWTCTHQKKYLSVLARNSVVAGRIRTRHTEAYSDHGPGISVSQMISDWKRGPVILRWILSWNIACPSEDEKNRQRRSNRSDAVFSAASPWDTRRRSSTYSLRASSMTERSAAPKKSLAAPWP